jgi:GH18 family chitinase
VNLDWEYPATKKESHPNWTYRVTDYDNLALFFNEVKAHWNQIGHKEWILTQAMAGTVWSGTRSAWAKIAQVLDYALVMSCT